MLLKLTLLLLGMDELSGSGYLSTLSSPFWSSMSRNVNVTLLGPLIRKVTDVSTSVPDVSTNCCDRLGPVMKKIVGNVPKMSEFFSQAGHNPYLLQHVQTHFVLLDCPSSVELFGMNCFHML